MNSRWLCSEPEHPALGPRCTNEGLCDLPLRLSTFPSVKWGDICSNGLQKAAPETVRVDASSPAAQSAQDRPASLAREGGTMLVPPRSVIGRADELMRPALPHAQYVTATSPLSFL